MSSPRKPEYLCPSALGSKDHWDEAYQRELANYSANPDDEGTIWFDDSNAEQRMIQYLEKLNYDPCDSNVRVLDLGTGNGHMLFELRENGWEASMLGVDYSEASIELARRIATMREFDEPAVRFETWDILKSKAGSWLAGGFDIVLDKGTFDAISLSEQAVDQDGRRGCEVYASKIVPLLKPGGIFLVTSCNWTTQELRKWFEIPGLAYLDTIEYPSFSFGGQKGQSVSSVCFKKKGQAFADSDSRLQGA